MLGVIRLKSQYKHIGELGVSEGNLAFLTEEFVVKELRAMQGWSMSELPPDTRKTEGRYSQILKEGNLVRTLISTQ